jgi:putative transposase
MSRANPAWGSPGIMGELRKLGIEVAKSSVEQYRVRPRRPSFPPWKTFLKNHRQELAALDFFVAPTVTYKVLFVLLILAHERCRVAHFNITEHPTALWTAQQVVEAFPWDEARSISCATATGSMGPRFGSVCSTWESKKC